MEISEVRIKLVTNPSERLRAFCSVTLSGDFVIRDLKIIEGVNGVFVAMPSRKLSDRCTRCGCKNHLRARFCNECGAHLKDNRVPKDGQGRAKLHADIAHPINAGCRERIQNAVVEAYQAELERSKAPDYKPQSFDDFDDFEGDLVEAAVAVVQEPSASVRSGPGEGRGPGEDEFSDYNSLIADLKRDAADRREPSSDLAKATAKELRLPPAAGENAVGKPAYTNHKRPAERPGEAEPSHKAAEATPPAAHASRDEAAATADDAFGAGLV